LRQHPAPGAILPSPTPPLPRVVSQGSVHMDALRGAASLLVFVNHTRALYFASPLAPPESRRAEVEQAVTQTHEAAIGAAQTAAAPKEGIKLASEAVVIFFVLSGYLVGGSVIKALQNNTWSWKDYTVKRLTRLWVPLFPCLLICLFLDRTGSRLFGEGSIYHNPAGIDLVTSVDLIHRLGLRVFLGNLFFFQGILVSYQGTNVSLWSLANEFWYYVAFPCLALACIGKQSGRTRILSAALGIAILAFTGWSIAALFPIWLFGALLSLIPKTLTPKQARQSSLVAFPILLICMLGFRVLPVTTIVGEYIVGLVATALLYLLSQQNEPSQPNVYRKAAESSAQISYTLYIVHLPIAIFLASLINYPWHRWARTSTNLLLFFVSDGLVLTLAVLLWQAFESKTDGIRRRFFVTAPSAHAPRSHLP